MMHLFTWAANLSSTHLLLITGHFFVEKPVAIVLFCRYYKEKEIIYVELQKVFA